MTTNTTLLIIDIQIGLLEAAHESGEILEHICTLIEQARASGTPTLYVQHDGPKGHGGWLTSMEHSSRDCSSRGGFDCTQTCI